MKINIHKGIILLTAFFLIVHCSSAASGPGDRYISSSGLAKGKWVKLQVNDNAIYKLTYEDIKGMGIEDPSKANIYGYGGWILDENFMNNTYIDDLPEVSCWVNKGGDNVFGPGDYLLFYGRGVIKWYYSSKSGFEHVNNPYATYGCYFLTQGERGPKEMESIDAGSGSPVGMNTFIDYYLHEKDLFSVIDSGRELFGENFINNTKQTFRFDIPGAKSSGNATLSFAAGTLTSAEVAMNVNGVKMIAASYMKTSLSDDHGSIKTSTVSCTNLQEQNTVDVIFSGSASLAALNFIRLNVERELKNYGEACLFFRNKPQYSAGSSTQSPVKYEIGNASGLLVFDVSDNYNAKLVKTTPSGSNLQFISSPSGSTLSEFALVNPDKSFPKPISLGVVENQDLHALPQTDMVIICPRVFLPQANMLAEEHRTRSHLRVTVAEASQIYNEFASGTFDATAYRRFMKMFYDRAETEGDRPRYLLLFGDGIYDNRFLVSDAKNLNKNNFLLTYQVAESLNEATSYGTDDYFGFLRDANESLGSSVLMLGIGRLPVRTQAEATTVVEKIIHYMNNTNRGKWKNNLIIAADNSDNKNAGNSFCQHAAQAEQISNIVELRHPEYLLNKVYLDGFKEDVTGGKSGYPGANRKLDELFKSGVFLFNYMGHGSKSGLAAENFITMAKVNQMSFKNLPLWITATCSFGWFDCLSGSAGEAVLLNKQGGGIALFTTTRLVYISNNFDINKQFTEHLFVQQDGEYLRLGDIMRQSKVALQSDANKLNYILLGDPALRLNYPKPGIEIREINGAPVDNDNVHFKGMELIRLSGVVLNAAGDVDTQFNGRLDVTALGSQQTIQSVIVNNEGGRFAYKDYPGTIFMGIDSVKNGTFNVQFRIPYDIDMSDNKGKMNFYASSYATSEEVNGSFMKYILNGMADNIPNDPDGPVINYLYLNSTAFKSGDIVNSTPYFIAEVMDDIGINMTGSSLGHDIILTIDRSPFTTYPLNNYFVPGDEYGKGTVRFSIPDLPAGKHTLEFKVWDLLNNSTSQTVEFYVDASIKPRLFDLMASANPAKARTSFILQHDRPNTDVEVELFIYDLSGRPVWRHKERGSTDWMESYPIEWNLVGDNGQQVDPGVYVYQAAIKTADSKTTTEAKKIVVVGQ